MSDEEIKAVKGCHLHKKYIQNKVYTYFEDVLELFLQVLCVVYFNQQMGASQCTHYFEFVLFVCTRLYCIAISCTSF